MKKVNPANKTKAFFGFFTALALAVGVGVSIAPREIVKAEAEELIATFKSADVVTDSGYKAYSNADWVLTRGGNNSSAGTNSGNRSSANLSSYSKYAVSPVTTSNTAYAIGNLKPLSNIGKVTYSIDSGEIRGNVYLISSPDLNSGFAQVSLETSGSQQGVVMSSSVKEVTFEFETITAPTYFAIVIKDTGSSGHWRHHLVEAKFSQTIASKVLTSIAVTSQPSKKNYYVDEIFDKAGMVVTAYYNDGSDDVVSNDDVVVTPNIMALGVTSVEVDYQGAKDTISGISVESMPTVDSLEVTGALVKSEYTEGATFDPTGLVVTAHLSNSTTLDVTSLVTYSPSPLTMGTTEVTISYGGKTASVSVVVSEHVPQVGVYTITSKITSGADYDGDPDLDKFDITKTNSSQEMFVLGDKENFRVGAGPNVTDIMLGGTTAPGKVSFTMPAGVYVAEITLHDLKVSDGNILISADGNKTGESLPDGATVESIAFNIYANKVTLQTTKRLWIGSISIVTATLSSVALDYAHLFLSSTATQCAAGYVHPVTWGVFNGIYSGMDSEIKAQFSGVLPNEAGDLLEQYVARYTYIGEKYGYYDFMGLGLIQHSINNTINKIGGFNILITVTVVTGAIGLITLAGYYFLKKKKAKSY